MNNKGYTLMEMVVVVSLLVVIMVGGTSLFLTNLRSGGTSEVVLKTARTARVLADLVETRLRYGRVIQVGELSKDLCLEAGTDGVSGSSVLFENLQGEQELLAFSNGEIASSSADGSNSVRLNNDEVRVESFEIKWFCIPGLNDKIKVDMSFGGSGVGLKNDVFEKISREMILLNSGTK